MAIVEDESWLSAIISEYAPIGAETSKGVELKTHERGDSNRNKCKKCGTIFTDRAILESHEKCCTCKLHICEECGKMFKNTQHLKWHSKTHGTASKNRSKRSLKQPDTFSFDDALSAWESSNPSIIDVAKPSHSEAVVSHVVNDNNLNTEGISEKVSVKHVQTQEDLDNGPDLPENHYTCSQCDQWYGNSSELLEHIRSHTQMNCPVLVCKDCDRRFTNAAALQEHRKSGIHDEQIKPFACDCCNKRFKYKDNLKQHRLTHSVAHPYSCPACNKVYSQQRSLRRHMQEYHPDID